MRRLKSPVHRLDCSLLVCFVLSIVRKSICLILTVGFLNAECGQFPHHRKLPSRRKEKQETCRRPRHWECGRNHEPWHRTRIILTDPSRPASIRNKKGTAQPAATPSAADPPFQNSSSRRTDAPDPKIPTASQPPVCGLPKRKILIFLKVKNSRQIFTPRSQFQLRPDLHAPRMEAVAKRFGSFSAKLNADLPF